MCLWAACIMGIVTHFNDRRRKNDMFQEMQPFNIDDESLHFVETIHHLSIQRNQHDCLLLGEDCGGGSRRRSDNNNNNNMQESTTAIPTPSLPFPEPSRCRRKYSFSRYGTFLNTLHNNNNNKRQSTLSTLSTSLSSIEDIEEEEKKQDDNDIPSSEDEGFHVEVDLVVEVESYVS